MSVNGSLRNLPPQSVSLRATAANTINFNGHQQYSNSRRKTAVTRTSKIIFNRPFRIQGLSRARFAHSYLNYAPLTYAQVILSGSGYAFELIDPGPDLLGSREPPPNSSIRYEAQ
ncbi:hypothetical protein TYRP_013568 [Tyrophagus putrescentiae]|nr:hypothetical protein TYRP_013568 [Tyrophagus putrescentiae]